MIKNMVKTAAGLWMIATVLIGYIPQPEYLDEMTCVSNTLGGLLLLADGILNMTKKKNLPSAFYLNVAVSILTVFLICMGSLSGVYRFNFQGAFFFLHVVNPIVFILCYILFVDERNRKSRFALAAPIMFMVYLLFDYLRCQVTGQFVYGFVEPQALTFGYAVMAGAAAYALLCLLGLGLLTLNRAAHSKGKS